MIKSGKENFLIDGFPRNQDNVSGWKESMDGKVNIQCVLFFDCDEKVSITLWPPFGALDRCLDLRWSMP